MWVQHGRTIRKKWLDEGQQCSRKWSRGSFLGLHVFSAIGCLKGGFAGWTVVFAIHFKSFVRKANFSLGAELTLDAAEEVRNWMFLLLVIYTVTGPCQHFILK